MTSQFTRAVDYPRYEISTGSVFLNLIYCNVFIAILSIACMTGALWAKLGKRDILREARDEGKRKIKRLFAVYCSCSLRSRRYCVVVEWDLAAEPLLYTFFGTRLRRQNYNLTPIQYRQLRRLLFLLFCPLTPTNIRDLKIPRYRFTGTGSVPVHVKYSCAWLFRLRYPKN